MLELAMWITIKTLYDQGYTKTKIAKMLNINRKTVRIVLKKLASGQVEPNRKVVKSIIDPYKEYIEAKVAKGLQGVRIYQDIVKEKGYQGSYETLKRFIKEIKKSQDVYIHIPALPAEEAQVDFGYAGLIPDEDGKLKKSWVFCYELVYSHKNYFEIVRSEEVKVFLRCHRNAFRATGGVPKTVKIDNLKSAILEASFYEPEYQKEYLKFANYYGFQPIPCRISTPTDKASIECGVKYVKNNFLKGKSFSSLADANEQLCSWTREICNKRIHGTAKRSPEEIFQTEEKHLLLPLPETDYRISDWVKRNVSCNCHISYKNNFYSVPYQYVHKEVLVEIEDKLLKVHADNNVVAIHPVLDSKGKFQTNLSHYPKYKVIDSTEYQNNYREKMAEIGEYAVRYFEYLLEKQKRYWYRTVKGIIQLSKEYDKQQVDIACGRALHFGAYGYKVIKSICEKGIREVDSSGVFEQESPKTGEYQRSLEEYQEIIWKDSINN